MCLYPKRIQNRKYISNKKNGGVIPTLPVIGIDEEGNEIKDLRILQVEVPCGRCIECCQQKAREWQVRLGEEIKLWKYMYFVTFTFSPKGLREICFKYNIPECNAAATFALRKSLELYRKYNKKSYRHWCITELGHEGTERIHMHGIIFFNEEQEFKKIEQKKDGWMCEWKYWRYGHIFVGDYVSEKSVNYLVKYMQKIDNDHKTFVGVVLASPGIGRSWIERIKMTGEIETYKYRPKQTKDYYRLNNGCKIKIPKYYGNKIWTEEEKELKWREFLDTGKETISGITYFSNETTIQSIGRITARAQETNKELEYGDSSKEWRKQPHNITKRMLQDQERKRQQTIMAKALGLNPDSEKWQRQLIELRENKEKMKKIRKKIAESKKK